MLAGWSLAGDGIPAGTQAANGRKEKRSAMRSLLISTLLLVAALALYTGLYGSGQDGKDVIRDSGAAMSKRIKETDP
ncbi:hypothetical protein [Paenibacillus sp. SYP-B4298]|uniref:hypothetical protein n=1 Tax=Paenibacillus sp. SYP-B4298 TaxID=2996034 RepID=UPI0022DD0D6E|nr:hypothetical protein [Paenibacillus sp. SYP-B4298]